MPFIDSSIVYRRENHTAKKLTVFIKNLILLIKKIIYFSCEMDNGKSAETMAVSIKPDGLDAQQQGPPASRAHQTTSVSCGKAKQAALAHWQNAPAPRRSGY
jgi:hypothetical protein